MKKAQEYNRIINLHLKFFKFLTYWDLHKDDNLQSPHSEYNQLRSELIDALLLLDKDEDSQTAKAIRGKLEASK